VSAQELVLTKFLAKVLISGGPVVFPQVRVEGTACNSVCIDVPERREPWNEV
jgi:hypothetical protein